MKVFDFAHVGRMKQIKMENTNVSKQSKVRQSCYIVLKWPMHLSDSLSNN